MTKYVLKPLLYLAIVLFANEALADGACESVDVFLQKLKKTPENVYGGNFKFLFSIDWTGECASWRERTVAALREELHATESKAHYPLQRKIACAHVLHFLRTSDERDEVRVAEIIAIPYANQIRVDTGLDRSVRRIAYWLLGEMKAKSLSSLKALAEEVRTMRYHEAVLAAEILFEALRSNPDRVSDFKGSVEVTSFLKRLEELDSELAKKIELYGSSDMSGAASRLKTHVDLHRGFQGALEKAETVFGSKIPRAPVRELGPPRTEAEASAESPSAPAAGLSFARSFLSNRDPAVVLPAILALTEGGGSLPRATIEALIGLSMKPGSPWQKVREAATAGLATQLQLRIAHLLARAAENSELRNKLGPCLHEIFSFDFPDGESL